MDIDTTPAPDDRRDPVGPQPAQQEAGPGSRKADRVRVRRRGIILAASLAVLLGTTGTAAWAADRYLAPHVEVADVSEYEAQQSASGADADTGSSDAAASTEEPLSADGSARGDTAITVEQRTVGSGDDTVAYTVADVVLGDATDLRSAFANDQFGTNIVEQTSEIAAENGAVFAVNGDYYGFRDTGIVIRNGVAYRDEGAREGLAFRRDGSVELYDETETSADALVADGVWNTLSFGPGLVEGGEIVAGIEDAEVDTNFGNHSIQGEQPRTAVGVIDENHLVFVVVDGRDPGYSRGVTMTELAEIMRDLGADTAYNLDGGGSSTMYYDGAVVNRPSNGGERGTSDILYIAGGAS